MSLQKVRLAIMAPTLNLCNYLFGIEKGFFLREGIEVEVLIRPGPRNTEAVRRGEADFGAANECLIQEALRSPGDLRILLHVLRDPFHSLIVAPEIRTLTDLKGGRIAVPAANSIPAVQTRLFLEKNGLVPGRDLQLVFQTSEQTMADRIKEFEQGTHQGLIASPPTPFLLESRGFHSLTELSEQLPRTASHGLMTTTSTIEGRGALVNAMVRGYVRGVTALKEDRKAGVDFVAARFRLDPPLASRCYDLLRDRWTAELSLDFLRSEIEFQAGAAGLPPIAPESIVDERYTGVR